MKFCPSCGSKLNSTGSFCPSCGFKLIKSSNNEEMINEVYETPIIPEKQSNFDFSINSNSDNSSSVKRVETDSNSSKNNTPYSYNTNKNEEERKINFPENNPNKNYDTTKSFNVSPSKDLNIKNKTVIIFLFVFGGVFLFLLIKNFKPSNNSNSVNNTTNTYNPLTDSNNAHSTQNNINDKNALADTTKQNSVYSQNNNQTYVNQFTNIKNGAHFFWLVNDKLGDQPPGTVTIKNIGSDRYSIQGKQIFMNNIDYIEIKGIINVISDEYFNFEGEISFSIRNSNFVSECVHKEKQLFKSRSEKGIKKYWRLERIENCDRAEGQTSSDIEIEF